MIDLQLKIFVPDNVSANRIAIKACGDKLEVQTLDGLYFCNVISCYGRVF